MCNCGFGICYKQTLPKDMGLNETYRVLEGPSSIEAFYS